MFDKTIVSVIALISVLTLIPFLYQTQSTNSNLNNPIIYEISLRPWLYELSNKYGRQITKLNDIPMSEFQHLKSVGVEYVWLMGIWKLGSYGVNFDRNQQDQINYYKSMIPDFTLDDVIGSPYAVTEFVCNPELGTDADILSLKLRLNQLGLKLMLDFVPNHSAVDSPYTVSNPDYYIRAPKGSQPPYDSSKYLPNGLSYGGDLYDGFWKDTAQWNYWNKDARVYLKSVVLKIASLSDGMRCDMAMVLLNDLFYQKWRENLDNWGYQKPSEEFWKEAIRETKQKYFNYVFLAEVYWGKEQELINNGFDFIYEKTTLDTLASLDVNAVRNNINSLSFDFAQHSNHFIENHDEPRSIEKFGGKDYIANVAAMISYTLPGAKFINHGQLEGYRNKLDVHLRRAAPEQGSDYSKWFYSQLVPILSRPVFHENSSWQRLQVNGNDSWRFLAWKVTNPNEKLLVVINYSDSKASSSVIVPDASSGQIQVTELMSNQVFTRSGDDMKSQGLGIVIDSWNGQILKY